MSENLYAIKIAQYRNKCSQFYSSYNSEKNFGAPGKG